MAKLQKPTQTIRMVLEHITFEIIGHKKHNRPRPRGNGSSDRVIIAM